MIVPDSMSLGGVASYVGCRVIDDRNGWMNICKQQLREEMGRCWLSVFFGDDFSNAG